MIKFNLFSDMDTMCPDLEEWMDTLLFDLDDMGDSTPIYEILDGCPCPPPITHDLLDISYGYWCGEQLWEIQPVLVAATGWTIDDPRWIPILSLLLRHRFIVTAESVTGRFLAFPLTNLECILTVIKKSFDVDGDIWIDRTFAFPEDVMGHWNYTYSNRLLVNVYDCFNMPVSSVKAPTHLVDEDQEYVL